MGMWRPRKFALPRLKFLAAVLVGCGCVSGQVEDRPHSSVIPHEHLRQRGTNFFAGAVFYKPATTNEEALEFRLAPLILQEVSNGSATNIGAFGALTLSNRAVALNPERPVIYFGQDTVEIKGKRYPRLAYLWFYSFQDSPDMKNAVLPLQGVRITLNSSAEPVIWEVLADTTGLGLIYVAQELERAALAEYRAALPGRRYAIENSLAEAPGVLVPRVVDDGPVAMGPVLYLSAGSRNVSTLICRCMPPQVKALVATRTYELEKIRDAPVDARLALLSPELKVRVSSWAEDAPAMNRISTALRLPTAPGRAW
jgi:hypothetical protein